LSERDVFRESAGGEPFGRAGEQREKSAPRRVGTRRAPREEGGDRGAAQGLLEVGTIIAGRAQEDGHPVEGHAPRGLALDAPRDLDALARLARPRLERDGGVERRERRGGVLEEVSLQSGEGRG